MVARIVLAAVLAAGFVYGWQKLDRIPMLVVGQPHSVGVIQSQFEAPFFETLAAETGLPIDVNYRSNDELGFKDTFQLKMLRSGYLDLASLRMPQNVATEPTLLGLDLVGFTTDLSTARRVAEVYAPIVDARLGDQYDSKLLGVWSFGPQVFFCTKAVSRLSDLAGLRVRVANDNFAPLLTSLDATPMVLPFEDVQKNLSSGSIDCAITSAASGYTAGWGESSTHLFLLTTQFGINAYVVSNKVWNRLSTLEQRTLADAFTRHVDQIWDVADGLNRQAISCLSGEPCGLGVSGNLIVTVPSAEDKKSLESRFEEVTFREWAATCDAVTPGCASRWRTAVNAVRAGN